MNDPIRNIEGIGPEFQDKLEFVGIRTVPELLAKTLTEQDRAELAKASSIPQGYIDNWASMLDLTRVEGIGYQYAELLTYSGVKSVKDLRKRNPENLYELVNEANQEKHFSGTVPSSDFLASIIDRSKKVTNIIERY